MLGYGTTTITLRVDSAPDEPLRLLLRPRADDRISQGIRFLNLRISSYRVVPEIGATVALPPALDFTIRDDEPPGAQQVVVGGDTRGLACVHLNDGSVRCGGDNSFGQATPPEDLGPVTQIGVGHLYGCALTLSGRVRCWGHPGDGRTMPPANLNQVAQIVVGRRHSCAVTASGQVGCWGRNDFRQATPPGDLGPVAQIGLGGRYSCALTISGQVRCWGYPRDGRTTPPVELGPVAQLGVGSGHNCALTVSGQVRCWGFDANGRTTPPVDLGAVAQLAVGESHSCALTVSGRVRCWGDNSYGQAMPPVDLGPVAQLSVGRFHSCALKVSDQLRCWGTGVDISHLPPGLVTAIDPDSRCALLAEGSVYCPSRPELAPFELRSDVVMSVWPRQLLPGQRAAIRFSVLREATGTEAFSARIEVFGERAAEIGGYYRLLDGNGIPLETEVEADGSYRYQLQGNPPMAWLEATGDDRSSRLYVRPLELLSASGPAPSIRKVAQSIELIDGLSFTASTYHVTEGAEDTQLSIMLPLAHIGLQVEMELTVSGTALAGSDYTLVAADSEQGIVLGDGTTTITLRVDSAPDEPLRLLLRPRADDRISQGIRFLNLRISRYLVPETGATVDLPPALDLTIGDDEPPRAQQVVVGLERNFFFSFFACVHLDDGSVRCAGSNDFGEATPPDDLGPVAQIGVGDTHGCALTISGEVRCWGWDGGGQSSPPGDLGAVAQLSVSEYHSCVLTVSGQVRCWGDDRDGRSTPPVDLESVAQLALGDSHSCALTVSGEVRCWGDNRSGQSSPPVDLGSVAQISVARYHSCALTVSGQVGCWGRDREGQLSPPADLGPVAQIALGEYHSCALTVSGEVRCWGSNGSGRSTPPEDLGVAAQIVLGRFHSCAVTVSDQLRCWGSLLAVSHLPPGLVTAVETEGLCALLADGSVYCQNNPELVPPELRPGNVVMSVWPRQLGPGQRAAIRFSALQRITGAFTARIEVFGDGSADIGRYYRLLDSSGTPLVAEEDGSYLLGGDPNSPQLAGNSLEATGDDRSSLLYVRPIELLSAFGPPPSIRKAAQPIELIVGLFFTASTHIVAEGAAEAQLSILSLLAHTGLRVEMELTASGIALAGSDYTLVAADPAQGIVLGYGTTTITLRVDSLPDQPLRLLLRPRADDRIRQGDRLLNLRISRYRVVSENGGTVDLPPALDFTIRDDEPPTVQQVLVGLNGDFACVHLNDGSVRCGGSNDRSQSTPPEDLGLVAQLAVGNNYSCALTVSGEVRCWGNNENGQASPPEDLGVVAQLAVGDSHSCALTVSGEVRCWGNNENGQASPPEDLGVVAQLAVGDSHSCALTVSGEVRCWGSNESGRSTPHVDLDDLGPVAQIDLGDSHSCGLTELGEVRCWGDSAYGQSSPTVGLGTGYTARCGRFSQLCADGFG